MIDLKQELSEFRSIELNDISRNCSEIPDNIKNSVILYNKAIESLKNGSEDIAIIELKKAVSMNPHFYEAMNLLGVCYSYVNEKAKALELFGRIVESERNGVKAMRYIGLLGAGEDSAHDRARKRKGQADTRVNALPGTSAVTKANTAAAQEKDKRSGWTGLIKVIGAFAAGAVIMLVINIILPEPGKTSDIPNTVTTPDTKAQEELSGLKTRYTDLESQYALLQKDKESANQQVDYYKSVMKLYDVESLVGQRQYEAAADMLLLLKTVSFSGADKERFDKLYSSVMPDAAWVVFNQGYSLYNKKSYEESYKKLEKVQLYKPDFESSAAVLYYMGRDSQQLSDARNAAALFQKLISTYPDTTYAKNAAIKLKQLTDLP